MTRELKMTSNNVPQPPIDTTKVRKVYWQSPHESADAFMLMLYASKDNSVTEYLWNSRDGVTPFGVNSRDGKVELFHTAWSFDIYCPKYRPPVGMRIFVNMTEERAREHARVNVEKWWHKDGFQARFPDKELAIDHFASDYFGSFGTGTTPDIIEVDEAWLAAN